MKKVYLILLWIWLAFTAMAQQSSVFQGTYNSGQHHIYHSSLVTDTVNPTVVSQDAKVELRAATSIRLLPGFRAGGFTPGNGGYFLARLGLGGSRKDTAICKGQQIQLGDSAEWNVSYAWSPSIGLNDTTLSNPLANPDSTTMYLVLKTYPYGRVEIDTVVVVVNPLPLANAGVDVAMYKGGSEYLGVLPDSGNTYLWSPSFGLNEFAISNPIVTSYVDTTYTLKVTNERNCIAFDTVKVLTIIRPNYVSFPGLGFCDLNPLIINYEAELLKSGIKQSLLTPTSLDESAYPAVPQSDFPTSLIEYCGNHFRIYYSDLYFGIPQGFNDPVSGADRRNIVCEVLTYFESVFHIPNGVVIDVYMNSLINPNPGAFGGKAIPQQTPLSTGSNILQSNILKFIIESSDPNPSLYETEIQINWAYQFNSTMNPSFGCQVDLFSVLLHEWTHSLGIFSSIFGVVDPNTSIPTGAIQNFPNHMFSLYDKMFLYKGNIVSNNFNKLVLNTGGSIAYINPIYFNVPGVLTSSDIWVYDSIPPYNIAAKGGSYNVPFSLFNYPATLSHLDSYFQSFPGTAQFSPGYQPNYVMGPFTSSEFDNRNWTEHEIKLLHGLGYQYNSSFLSSTSLNGTDPNSTVIHNSIPYRSNISSKVTEVQHVDLIFPETMNQDLTLVNDNSIGNPSYSFIDINLFDDPTLSDPESDPISVYPGSLINIRGCSDGGNNHNLLSLSNNNQTIRFTPKAGYWGLSQFGFNLYDGHEKGAFKIYTIKVDKGAVSLNPGQELVNDGGYEDGSESRQRLGNTNLDYSVIKNGFMEGFFSGNRLSGSHPFSHLDNIVPFGCGGDFLRYSWKDCSISNESNNNPMNGMFGFSRNSSDNGSVYSRSYPLPIPGIGGDFYHKLSHHQFNTLKNSVVSGKQYQIEFDICFKDSLHAIGQPFEVEARFCDDPYPSNGQNPAVFQSSKICLEVEGINTLVNSSPLGDVNDVSPWQHVKAIFSYCSSNPADYLWLYPTLDTNAFIDNVSLVELSEEIPLTDFITNSSFEICSSNPITIDIASPYSDYSNCHLSYEFPVGTNITLPYTFSPASSGSFTIQVEDGCRSETKNFDVTVNTLPNTSFSGMLATYCQSNSGVTLVGSPSGGTFSGTGIIGNTFTPNTIGTFTITYTSPANENGCIGTSQQIVTVYANPTVGINADGLTTFCDGGSVNLTSSTASSYLWSTGETTQSIEVSTPGNYSVTVTDINGCTATSDVTAISINQLPNASAGSDASICLGSSTQLNATGGATYSWSPATGLSATDIANPVANPTHTTDYTVTVTDGNGCSQTDIVTVTVNNLPTVTISPSGSTTFCQGGSVTLNASSGTSYSWNTGATTQSITVSTAGNYSVTVTDGNGCSGSNSVTISTISNPTVSIETITPSSCSSNNCTGSATIDITNSSNYAINWNTTPDQTGLTATGLCPGNYLVTVTDNTTDCETQQPIVVDFSGNCCYNPDFDGVLNNVSYSGGLGTLGILPGVQVVPGAVSGSAPRVLNNKFTINGTFTIQSDLNFQGCEILMGPDAQIVVLNGADVNFDQCYIHECRLFWNYISMGNNSKIYFNNSIVQGARIGVFALGSNLSTTLLSVENSIFNRNGIHLFTLSTLSLHVTGSKFGCNNLSGLGTSWPQNIQTLSFGSNTFLPSAFLNSTTSMVGILATQNNSITIGDMNENSNLFQNCGLGIANLSSSVKIYNSIFKGMFNQTTNPINTNGIGIWARANSNKQNYSFLAEENSFENCQFAGMKVENYKQSVTVKNNTVNLGNGQYSNFGVNLVNNTNSAITMVENQIHNCLYGLWSVTNRPASLLVDKNVVAYRNTTNSISYGIAIWEGLPSGTIPSITNNFIYNTNYGISLLGLRGAQNVGFSSLIGSVVTGNFINPPASINPPIGNMPGIVSNNELQKGFALYGQNMTWLVNNFAKGYSSSFVNGAPAGFYSSIGSNFFVCNTSQDVYRGFTFSGASNPSWMIKNEMNSHSDGLVFTNGGAIGDIGSVNQAYDNTWQGSFTNSHIMAVGNISYHNLYYRSTDQSNNPVTGPPYKPTVVIPATAINALSSNSNYENFDCIPETGTQMVAPIVTDLSARMLMVLKDTTKQDENYEAFQWMQKLSLYEFLQAADSLISNNTLFEFRDSCKIATIGLLKRTELVLENLKKNQLYSFANQYKDSLETITPDNAPEANIRDLLKMVFEKNNDTVLVIDSSLFALNYFLQDSLGIVSLTSSFYSKGNFKYSLSEKSIVDSIAALCPYSDGPGVYWARSLLASITDSIPIQQSIDCGSVSSTLFKMEENNNLQHIDNQAWANVYPNPSLGNLTVKWNFVDDMGIKIKIDDLSGRTIFSIQKEESKGELTFNANVASGTYIIRLESGGFYKEKRLIILLR